LRIGSLSRRELLQAAAVAAATGLLPSCRPVTTGPAEVDGPTFAKGGPIPWRNWAGNQSCLPSARVAPDSEDALQTLLRSGDGALRPVGTGHSFSALVPSQGTLVAADLLGSGLVGADRDWLEAEAWAGTRLHTLGPALHAEGLALSNLPDIDYQTLGGALATSTHGTGPRFGSLSSMVGELTLATPRGELLVCDRERSPEVFHAARCSLGALGVVTRARMRCQTPFHLVETNRFEPLEDVLAEVESRRDAHRHFEFHAFPHTGVALTVTTDEGGEDLPRPPEDDPDAVELLRDVYRWVGRVPWIGDWLYDQMVRGVGGGAESRHPGQSFQVLTHPRLVPFREMEYTVPAEAGPACLRQILATIREREIPIVFPIEYRYVAADDVWLSMFHERAGCTISVHQYADEDHRPYFREVEPIFWKYDGRPHWGKLHTLGADQLRRLYPRWQDFAAVREALDPGERMLNDHLRAVFGV
jgi:FAD-linked oxidoreductase